MDTDERPVGDALDPTSVQPTFTTPSSATSLTFQLVVTDGSQSSDPSSVTIHVLAGSADLASHATASASSQNTSTDQTAAKAIDGVIDGYPGDYTKEWATVGGGSGSWLELTWPSPQTINDVVLYDRPNTSDQVTGGTLTFSDGSTVTVPALAHDGSATTVTFPAKTTTSVLFTVTSVSSSTQNVGLAEIEVFPPQGGGGDDAPPTANAGANQIVSTGAAVLLDGSASNDPGGNPYYKWTQTSGPAVTLSDPASVQPTFTAPSSPTSLTFQLVVTDGSQSSDPSSVTITVKQQSAKPPAPAPTLIVQPPVLSAVGVSPRKFVLTGRVVKGRCGAADARNRKNRACARAIALRVDYKLTVAARVTFAIKEELSGRLVSGRCVPGTRANDRQRHCRRLVSLPGSIARTGMAGANSFTFNGRIAGHQLAPGSYLLTASPTADGRTGDTQQVSVKILR